MSEDECSDFIRVCCIEDFNLRIAAKLGGALNIGLLNFNITDVVHPVRSGCCRIP